MGCAQRPAPGGPGGGRAAGVDAGTRLVSTEQEQDGARRVRAREVGLFRYGLIQDALDESLKYFSVRLFARPIASKHCEPV